MRACVQRLSFAFVPRSVPFATLHAQSVIVIRGPAGQKVLAANGAVAVE